MVLKMMINLKIKAEITINNLDIKNFSYEVTANM